MCHMGDNYNKGENFKNEYNKERSEKLKQIVEELKKRTGEQSVHPRDRRLLEPYEMFGIECGKGWESLYTPIMEWIEKYNEENPGDVITITQIKEKFGALSFYVDKYPEERHDLILAAEKDALNVCETCGTRENVGMTCDNWYRTICLDCLQKKFLGNPKYYKDTDLWRRIDNGVYGKVYKVTKDSIEEWTKGIAE